MVSFLDWEGNDPASMAREAAAHLTSARNEVERKGIKAFLFAASSVEEFDQRVEFGGVEEVLDGIADSYLGSPDERAKLTAALRREFLAQQPRDPKKVKELGKELTHPGTLRGHESLKPTDPKDARTPLGEQIVNEPGDSPKERAKNEKKRKSAEKETIELDSGDVEIEKGKLTKLVGGPPSENMGKVRELAENGSKAAQFFLNVLHKDSSIRREAGFSVCPTCEGRGQHVNPSIDSQGLSRDDFDEDPDFEEGYFSGAYDVPCAECGGDRVVPKCKDENCDKPAEPMETGYGDRRDRVSEQHYPACYDHLEQDDKDDIEDTKNMYAEMAAERAMGA